VNADQMRIQAARCFRTALACPDPAFARELVALGWELREKADRLEFRPWLTARCDGRISASWH
jgi:hypothetical protein